MITPLHIQSATSLKGNPFLVEDYVKNAVEKGYTIIVLNEWQTLASAITFMNICQRYNVQPVLAISFLYNEHVVSAICTNEKGYKELVQLTSQVNISKTVSLSEYKHLIYLTDQHQTFIALQNDVLQSTHVYFEATLDNKNDWQQVDNTQIVVSKTVDYLNKEDNDTFDVLQALIYKKERVVYNETANYLLASNEYQAYCNAHFSQHYYDNTLYVLSHCKLNIPLHQNLLPKVTENANEQLKKLAFAGLSYRQIDTIQYRERLNYELSVIEQIGYADYFLILWDVVQFTKTHNITLGAGRGSSAASLVLYCLEITNIDPLKYQLVFERFLNPERLTMPDVDLDLPDNKRYDVLNYVKQKYGDYHVAQIGTFQTYGPKGSIKELFKLFKKSETESKKWLDIIGNDFKINLDNKTLQQFIHESKENKKIIQLAKQIEKLPKSLSKHAAGVVISDYPIYTLVPVIKDDTNYLVTQFTMNDVETVGLVKMDFLGVRHLSVLSDAQHIIRQRRYLNFSIWDINLHDESTLALFALGQTDGVFQFDSHGIRETLKKVKPSSLEEVAIVCALYRPGPMNQTEHFYKRKFQLEAVEYIHSSLQPILQETYGVIVYQEQIMQIAVQMSNFTLGQADILRRAISKKNVTDMHNQKENFIKGAVQNGYTVNEANQVFDYIEKFAEYGFAKSHAFAYAIFAFQMAYIKAHYPQEYYLALLLHSNPRSDKYTQYITALINHNVTIRIPDINSSRSKPVLINDHTILLGLLNIKGVSKDAITAILTERKKGKFSSVQNFIERLDKKIVTKDSATKLFNAGCFDHLAVKIIPKDKTFNNTVDTIRYMRKALVDSFDKFDKTVEDFNEGLSKNGGKGTKIVTTQEYSVEELIAVEKDLLSYAFTINVFDSFRLYYDNEVLMPIPNSQIGQKVIFAIQFKNIRKITTKNNQRMAFVKLQDMYGEIDGVIFPNVFKQYVSLLNEKDIRIVSGIIEERNGHLQCQVQHIYTADHFEDVYKQRQKVIFIKVMAHKDVQQIKKVLQQNVGHTQVIIYFENEKKYHKLPKNFNVKINDVLIEQLVKLFGSQNVVVRERKNIKN